MRARLALAACALATPAVAQSTNPNNVLLIVLDDVGLDLVGCYDAYLQTKGVPPSGAAATPAIDTLLAARGVMFTRAWTAPICTPSRAQILTGLHASRNGQGMIHKQDGHAGYVNPGLPATATLLPQALHAAPAPYLCAAVGKWHLADRYQADALNHPLGFPFRNWFDYFAGSMFNLEHIPGSTNANVYSAWRKVYSSPLGLGAGPCPGGLYPCEIGMNAPPVANYATVDTANDALAMMATLPEPWFLYVAFNAAHAPTHAVPAGTPTSSCGAYSPSPTCTAPAGNKPARTRCMVEELDNQIGRILCASDENDTTVILIGDNGTVDDATLPPYLPEHGKGTMYQGGLCVPLIVRSPWVAPGEVGTVNESLVCSTDLYSTALQVAGVPGAVTASPDSISLVPYLTGQVQASIRKFAYAETFFPNFQPDPSTGDPPAGYSCEHHSQAIRDARYKLIRRTVRDRINPAVITVEEELYDLLRGGPPNTSVSPPQATPDWFEQNNLLDRTLILPGSQPAVALARLRNKLDQDFPTVVR